MGRRRFCAVLGAAFAGVVVAGCSGGDEAHTSTSDSSGSGVLSGLSFVVRRDPG